MATTNDLAHIKNLYTIGLISLEMKRREERCRSLKETLTGKYKTPQEFYDWHATLWNPRGNPDLFGPEIFHRNCLLTDPFLTMRGSYLSSLYFRTLFAVFPQLSGPHYSWAANGEQIFVNWAFRTSGGRVEKEVPAQDIFCFKDGVVFYRLATFDVLSLVRALINAYGHIRPELSDNLLEEMHRWHADPEYAEEVIAAVQAQNATGIPLG